MYHQTSKVRLSFTVETERGWGVFPYPPESGKASGDQTADRQPESPPLGQTQGGISLSLTPLASYPPTGGTQDPGERSQTQGSQSIELARRVVPLATPMCASPGMTDELIRTQERHEEQAKTVHGRKELLYDEKSPIKGKLEKGYRGLGVHTVHMTRNNAFGVHGVLPTSVSWYA